MEDNIISNEEISLKELFLLFWRKRILIVSVTVIAAILAALFSLFILSPVYQCKMDIVINMPTVYHTNYGDYTMPLTTNDQYINLIVSNDILNKTIKDMGYDKKGLTIEELRKKITVVVGNNKLDKLDNTFTINVKTDNALEAKKLSDILYNNYIEFLNIIIAQGAIRYYMDDYTTKLKSLNVDYNFTCEILAKNEELLSKTPQTINQAEALNKVVTKDINKFVVLEDVINPNYTKIESDIITNKQSISNFESTRSIYNTYLEELNKLQDQINNYNETGNFNSLDKNITNITKTYISLPSSTIAPSKKIGPNNAKNTIIGGVLGGLLVTGIVFIKEVWFNNAEPDKKKKK